MGNSMHQPTVHQPTDQDNREDTFELSGPKHLGPIDWANEEHRRCIAACLVKATCVMENDRTQCRMDHRELAPAWWLRFGFIRDKPFINNSNKHDQFTYGAIFRLLPPPPPAPHNPDAPEFVVAFRGTMLKHPKAFDDLVRDFCVLFNALSDFKEFKRTHSDVDSLMRDLGNGSGPVWLAGHSLGASLALEIGRKMMLTKDLNVNLRTFLFNPPHVSLGPMINWFLGEKHKTRLYTMSYAVKYGLAQVLSGHRKRTKERFLQLATWIPELYVNPEDCICQGYIDYFVQLEKVSKNHPKFAKTAARMSYRDMFFSMFSSKKLQPHLLPSARLWTSSTLKEAHGLHQWWNSDSDLALSSTLYLGPSDYSA